MTGISASATTDDGADDSSYNNTGLGYLTAPSMAPGHFLMPSSFFVLPSSGVGGLSRIDFDVHWANVWNYSPANYVIDSEWVRTSVRFTYPLRDDLSVGVAVPVIGRTGGFADSLIEKFHSVFNLGSAHRDEAPQNQSLVRLRVNGEPKTIVEGDAWGVGDILLFVVSRISDGDRILPAISLQSQISLPSGDKAELQGVGSSSIALSAVASKRLGRSPVNVFSGLGLQYCSKGVMSDIELPQEVWSGLFGFEYSCTRSVSLVTQYLWSSPAAEDYFVFSDPCHEVSVGCKWCTKGHTILELAIVENLFGYKNSADFGVHLGYGMDL